MSWTPEVPMDSEGGDYIKFEAGDIKDLTVLSDQPKYHPMHWINGQPQPHQEDGCTYCDAGQRISKRYTVAVQHNGNIALWEMAYLTWKDLADQAEMMGQLRGLVLKVKRSGSGRSTRYTVMVDSKADADNLPPEPEFEAGISTDDGDGSDTGVSIDINNLAAAKDTPDQVKEHISNLAGALDCEPKDIIGELVQDHGGQFTAMDSAHQLAAVLTRLEKYSDQAAAKAAGESPETLLANLGF